MKEEAKRLVYRFYYDTRECDLVTMSQAKQCAIICCEEISETHMGAEYHIYYKRLIEEIKKL